MLEKVKLSFRFGRPILAASLPLTLSAATVATLSTDLIPTLFILKVLSVPVILYLFTSLGKKENIYFWINMGISRKEYYLTPVVVEFLAFIVLISICGFLGYVIG